MRRAVVVLVAGLLGCGGDGDSGGGGGAGGGGPTCEAGADDCCATGEPLAVAAPADLHELLHGRWQICGGDTLPAGADGIEFRDGAFWQFLEQNDTGALIGDPANIGWQIDAAGGTCGTTLSLSRSTGGFVVAEARVYEGTPRSLRLDFVDEEGGASTACFVAVR